MTRRIDLVPETGKTRQSEAKPELLIKFKHHSTEKLNSLVSRPYTID